MRKTLTYSGFAIASLMVVLAFITATTYIQLGAAILIYPLLAYFAFKLFPRKAWKAPVITFQLPSKPSPKIETETPKQQAQVDIADIDKRAFLKLIGGAGVSFFLFSLLGRRAEALLPGKSLPGPETISIKDSSEHKIDPAERQPTDGYRISEIDDNDLTFYGFINKNGNWFIMKEDAEGSFRYSRGDLNFESGWTNREHLNYDYFHNVF